MHYGYCQNFRRPLFQGLVQRVGVFAWHYLKILLVISNVFLLNYKAKDATAMDEEVPEVIEVEKAPTKSVENAAQAIEAENATIQESSAKVAEEAGSENVKCDLCESEFQNSIGLGPQRACT